MSEHHEEPIHLSNGAVGEEVTSLEGIAAAYVLAFRSEHHLVLSIGAALAVSEAGEELWVAAVNKAGEPYGLSADAMAGVRPLVDIGGGLLLTTDPATGEPVMLTAPSEAFTDPVDVRSSLPAQDPFAA